MDTDAFALNISGVEDLVNSNTNKTSMDAGIGEGVSGEPMDILELDMTDAELLTLKIEYENKSAPYDVKVSARQKQNKAYLIGTQRMNGMNNKTVPSNLLFEATATFVPQALAKNPEPVVWSDNTEEGKKASTEIKTMLQYHADVLCLRKKLGVMVWHWSVYFTAVIKHGWDAEIEDITSEIRKPQNFLLDPDGFINEYGDFKGEYLGEKIQSTAAELARLYPKSKAEIIAEVGGKMGTLVTRTEWWSDKYCFTTYKEMVLDKHKNEFFNYEEGKINHFATPKMPYTFLSVFSLQEQPHDFTNLIEQNVSNQDRINERDRQIEKNLAHGNNSIVVSDTAFNSETAHQAADAMEQGDPILVSGNIDGAIKRIPANALPNGVLDSQQIDKDTLRGIYGTQGLIAQEPNDQTTARGMILNQNHDSSRIGGGIGDALEQVADNIFNWWTQLYYVFYDEKHYAAIMGQASAVEYVGFTMAGQTRHFVISVSPNSMQPKDEITEMNQAIQLAEGGWLDPLTLFKKLNYPDPMETAKAVTLFKVSPQMYMQTYFPEVQQEQQQGSPPGMPGQEIPEQGGTPDQSLAEPPASSALSQVSLDQGAAMPQ
jgi:hypothetical protein